MIVESAKRDITSHGIISSNKYKINASAKAFRLLYSSPYKNKIQAIVRELSCNAYDSHVAANKKDTPFFIHCPATLEPFFSIRDYGTGLSKKQIEEIYVTYFLSTKDDSNEYVGALGLGSKSPYSYTDSYTIVSYFGGKKYTYFAAIDANDEPTINLVSEIDTDEINGLEVIVPVQKNDFYFFEKEIHNVLKWFETKPLTNNNMVFNTPTPILSGDSWDVYSGVHTQFGVMMGSVLYPIDQTQLQYNIFQVFLNSTKSLIIKANIGDVDITLGREELSYDKKTIDWLKDAILKIRSEYVSAANNKIENTSNLRDALIEYSKYYVSDFIRNGLINKIKNHQIMNGIGLEVPSDLFKDFPQLYIKVRDGGNSFTKKTYEYMTRMPLVLFKNSVILFDDDQYGNTSKLRYFLRNYRDNVVIFPMEMKPLMAAYSDWEQKNISELPKEKRIRLYTPRDKSIVSIFSTHSLKSTSTAIDLDNTSGYYLEDKPTSKTNILNGKEYDRDTINKLIYNFKINENIIITNKSNFKKISNHQNWKPLYDILKQKSHDFCESNKNLIALAISSEYNILCHTSSYPLQLSFDGNHIVDDFNKCVRNIQYLTLYEQNLLVCINAILKLADIEENTIEKKYNLFELYPLMVYYKRIDANHMKEYIIQCDKLRELTK